MTHDELKAAAKRWTGAAYGTTGLQDYLSDAQDLADYAAASLDDRPLTREWLVKVLGEPSFRTEWRIGVDYIAPSVTIPRGFVGGHDECCHALLARADALAFFKLVRWPVEVGKIFEAAKCK